MFKRGRQEELERARFSRRIVLFGALQLGGLGLLGARLYQLQVLEGEQYTPLAEANRTSRQILAPLRGRIFDRQGNVVADTVEAFRVLVTPSLAGELPKLLDNLGQIVALDEADRERVMVQSRSQSAHTAILVADNLTWQEVTAINFNAQVLPGVHTEIGGRRRYAAGSTLIRIVGYVGGVQRFALDDDPVLRVPGMRIGKAGVEHGMEMRLRGTHGVVDREVDSRGRVVRQLKQTDPLRGRDVALTIDPGLQSRLLERLGRFRRAAGVVLDVASGDVVAMGAAPTFDLSALGRNISEADWERIRTAKDNPLVDRSYQGVYPPGSTFKMVTALAALDVGIISPQSTVNCTGTYRLGGQRFRCWNRSGHGPCNLHRALKESCDVYFYDVANRLGIEAIAKMARRLGLGDAYESGLALAKSGLVPDPAWKQGRFGKTWLPGETVLAAIGQGYVLATPLQLAVMTARLATGLAIEPTVVRPRVGPDQPFKPLGVKGAHLAAVQRAMWAAVNETGGTGKRARLEDAALHIAGKTGTSQVARISSRVSRENLRWDLRDHGLFVGYVADKQPRYAIAAIVEHGGNGGRVAAPLVRQIVEDVIAIDPAARPVFSLSGARDRQDRG